MGTLTRRDVLEWAMAESVPVRCPACRREHRYAAQSYPCVCGVPVAPSLDALVEPTVVTVRAWDDEWATVRCGACARETQWPHPELGCDCGTMLRIPVRAAGALPPPRDTDRATGPDRRADAGAGDRTDHDLPRGLPAEGGTRRPSDPDHRADAGTEELGAPGRDEERPQDGDRHGTPSVDGPAHQGGGGAGTRDTPPAEAAAPAADTGRDERHGAGDEATADTPGRSRNARIDTPPGEGHDLGAGATTGIGPVGGRDAGGDRAPGGGTGATVDGGTSDDGAGRRGPFRPVTIRTARDAVTAAALYLRWLGYPDVRRADQRPPSGIGLAARGILAQVDPTVRPASLRDVECLWLTAMTESAACVYFSLAGYAEDALARADALGVPLFVLDLTGTPQPVNSPADDLVAVGG